MKPAIPVIINKIKTGTPLTDDESKAFEEAKAQLGGNENGTVKSITSLATILGVARKTLYNWKNQGMPIEPDGTYDPEKILHWRGGQKGPTGTPMINPDGDGKVDERVYWETEFRKYRAKISRMTYRKEKGELIPKAEVEQLLVDRATEFKRNLLERGRRLSLKLAHKSTQEIQALLDSDSRAILEMYSRPNHLTGKSPKKQKQSEKPKGKNGKKKSS